VKLILIVEIRFFWDTV